MQSKHNEQQQVGYRQRLHEALEQGVRLMKPTVFMWMITRFFEKVWPSC